MSDILQTVYRDLAAALRRIETKDGATAVVADIFLLIAHFHGGKEAGRLFRQQSTTSKSDVNRMKGQLLLARYDAMKVKNISKLAEQIEAENAKLPADKQLTPRRRPSRQTIDAYLRQLRRDRRDL